MTIAACATFIGLGIAGKDGIPQRLSPQAKTMESLQIMWDWSCPRSPPMEGLSQFCLFGADWERSTSKILLWGDSHAEHIAPLLEALAIKHNASVILSRETGCPANVDGIHVRPAVPSMPNHNQYCRLYYNNIVNIINRNIDIDGIILAASWSNALDNIRSDGELPQSRGTSERLALEGLGRTIAAIAHPGRTIWLLSDIPQWPSGDPVPCMTAGFGLLRRPCPEDRRAIPRTFFSSHQGWAARIFGGIAQNRSDVRILLIGEAMCPDAYCIARIGSEPLYRDASHIRRNLPEPIKAQLAAQLGLEAIFERGQVRGAAP